MKSVSVSLEFGTNQDDMPRTPWTKFLGAFYIRESQESQESTLKTAGTGTAWLPGVDGFHALSK